MNYDELINIFGPAPIMPYPDREPPPLQLDDPAMVVANWNQRVRDAQARVIQQQHGEFVIMMTKKHFQQFADQIRKHADQKTFVGEQTAWAMADMVIDVCRADNSRFDIGRFLEACGLDPARRQGLTP